MWARGLRPGDAFDTGAASKALLAVLPSLQSGSTLVPGAGRAYDAAALATDDAHARSVVALDISPTACAAARRFLDDALATTRPAARAAIAVECADFFAYDPPEKFDVIWDCTFLCALEPALRDRWAAQTDRLLAEGGQLATLVFPIGKKPSDAGPPFELTRDLVRSLLAPRGFVESIALDLPPGTHMPGAPFGNAVIVWVRGHGGP